jgi:hypothetical protein
VEIELRKAGDEKEAAPPDRTHAIIDNSQVKVYQSGHGPAAGKNYVAVDLKTAAVAWDKMPEGSGPFVITELK